MKVMDLRISAQQIIDYLKANIQKYKNYYNESSLMQKIGAVAKTAGVNTVFTALKVYYAMKSKDVPVKDKIILAAALGYFIAPIDLIPDIFGLLGIVDDGIILKWAYDRINAYITPEMIEAAEKQLHKWFPKARIEESLLKSNAVVNDEDIMAQMMEDHITKEDYEMS